MTRPTRRIASERAVAAATAILRHHFVRSPEDIDIELIAMNLGVTVIRDCLPDYEGSLLRHGDVAVLAIARDAFGTARGRFVAAHELGHFVLHDGTDLASFCAGIDPTRRDGYEDDEAEACDFSAATLMPEFLFAPSCQGDVSLAVVRTLAHRFDTSLSTTALRLVELSPKSCAVVYTTEGVIRWWAPSATFDLELAREFALRPEARAYSSEMLRWHEGLRQSERVPADAWTDDPDAAHADLQEHSVRLGRGAALTMLW